MEKNRYIRFDWAAKYMLHSKADFSQTPHHLTMQRSNALYKGRFASGVGLLPRPYTPHEHLPMRQARCLPDTNDAFA